MNNWCVIQLSKCYYKAVIVSAIIKQNAQFLKLVYAQNSIFECLKSIWFLDVYAKDVFLEACFWN